MKELVVMKDQQAVTSSLQVAETFGKEHKNVMRDIRNLKKDGLNIEPMFSEANIPDSYGRDRRAFYMNRDGFTLLAMGFTGKKAMKFKLKYIEAFNSMEKQIKSGPDLDGLTPTERILMTTAQAIADHRRELNQVKLEASQQRQELNQFKREFGQVKHGLDETTKIMTMSKEDWRKETNRLTRKIGGARHVNPSAVYNEIYQELEQRAGCNLKQRLTNMKERKKASGQTQSAIDDTKKLDVIESDKKLAEIYRGIVKEYAIAYCVWNNEY